MIKLRFNEKSWSSKVKAFLEQGEEEIKDELKDIAEVLITRSPVQTGAYAASHSVGPSRGGRTRSRSSHGKSKIPLEEGRSVAREQMYSDIDSLDLIESSDTSVKFTNRAPHNQTVEDVYQVYGAARDTKM